MPPYARFTLFWRLFRGWDSRSPSTALAIDASRPFMERTKYLNA